MCGRTSSFCEIQSQIRKEIKIRTLDTYVRDKILQKWQQFQQFIIVFVDKPTLDRDSIFELIKQLAIRLKQVKQKSRTW